MSGSTYFLRGKFTVTLHALRYNVGSFHFFSSSAHKMMIFSSMSMLDHVVEVCPVCEYGNKIGMSSGR